MSEIDALEKAAKAAYEATKTVDMAPWDWDGPGSEAIREVYRKAARAVLAVGKAEMLAGLRERILPLLGQAIGYGEAHPVYSERAYHNGRVSAFEEVLVWLTEEAKRDE